MVALALIATTIVLGAVQLHRILEISHEKAEIVDIAGAQRMLSQRLALLTPRVLDAPNAFRQERAMRDMRVAVERMRAGHTYLTTPRENGLVPAEASPELIHHYAPVGRGLYRMADSFISAFEAFVEDPEGRAGTIEFHRVNAETGLLVRFDQAVALYTAAARQQTSEAIRVHGAWVALALVMLLIEIAVIFNPMARDAARSVTSMQAALDDRTKLLSQSMKIAKLGHWRATNAQADPIWLSHELLEMYGMEREEGLVPLSVIQDGDIIPDETPIESNTQHLAFKKTWETGEPVVARSQYRKPDGEIIDMMVHLAAELDDEGQVVAVTGVVKDVTEEAEAERALRESYELIEQKTDSLREAQRLGRSGTWRRPLDEDKLHLDSRAYELLRFEPGSLKTSRADMRKHYVGDAFDRLVMLQDTVVETGEQAETDVQMRRGDGAIIDMRIRMMLERDAKGEPRALFGTMQDVTSEKAAERELEQLAFYDHLTGLANRSLFTRELRRVCDKADAGQGDAALILLDLDYFKEVNDTLGHLAGDQLLEVVGRRLSEAVGNGCFVSRLGGDEFAVIVDKSATRESIDALCERIIEKVAVSADLNGSEVQTRCSIGIAWAPKDSVAPDELMRFADLALYASKENGRGRFTHFAASMSDAMGARLSMANEIRHALEDDRFEVHFQPIVDVRRGEVQGFESLLRLRREDGGYVPPGQFIPIAESSHLIADLGAFVLERACLEAQQWVEAGVAPRSVAVNVSAAQVWHGDLEKVVDGALTRSGLNPKLLCIELTESVFAAESLARLEGILRRLSERGISLALDDFGTGYSSLSYLNQLPFDKLKVDRAFISDLHLCADKRKMLRGIVSLGKGLDLKVVAEGVETSEELEVVRAMGCDFVQGWYYGKAEPSEKALAEASRIEAMSLSERMNELREGKTYGDAVMQALLRHPA
ncbi:MAG: EAL domain-containing protein [Devosiaceae bacterium]|nr:EAL domain-containing protein [Devosiaceae bacterium MH13]